MNNHKQDSNVRLKSAWTQMSRQPSYCQRSRMMIPRGPKGLGGKVRKLGVGKGEGTVGEMYMQNHTFLLFSSHSRAYHHPPKNDQFSKERERSKTDFGSQLTTHLNQLVPLIQILLPITTVPCNATRVAR